MGLESVSQDQIRELAQPIWWKSTLAIAMDWILVAANFALVIHYPHPLTYLFCFFFAARQQLAFAILMHDGSHRRLYKSVWLNDYVGQFFTAAPVFFSMFSYQKHHLKHHRDPLAPDDPDITLIGGYPIDKVSFLRKLLRDAIGISYFKFIIYFLYRGRKKKVKQKTEVEKLSTKGGKMPLPMVIFSMILVNGLMFSILYFFGYPWHYLFFWILPTMTALQLLLRIRGIAEHAGYQPNKDQRLNARTVVNPIQTFIFAPHGVNYHIEHHIFPAVPFYNLPQLHQIFIQHDVLPEKNLYSGYGQIVRELVR